MLDTVLQLNFRKIRPSLHRRRQERTKVSESRTLSCLSRLITRTLSFQIRTLMCFSILNISQRQNVLVENIVELRTFASISDQDCTSFSYPFWDRLLPLVIRQIDAS